MKNDFNTLSESVLNFISQSNGALSERSLQKQLGAYDSLSREVVSSAVKNLIKQAKIVALGDKLVIPSRAGLFRGRVRRNERGFGFFIPDCAEDCVTDLFLTPDRLVGVYQNDEVFVRRLPPNVGKGDGCEVISVISRGVRTLTGACRVNRGFVTIIPDDAAFGSDLTVIGKSKFEIKNGYEVLCEIVAYPFGKAPQVKILKVLGDSRSYKVREECVLLSLNAPQEFSKSALSEAEKLSDEPQKSDFLGRIDFCKLKTFTIDGDDSRDFDDAISIKKTRTSGGGFELYVHIADVSHYVLAGSALDKEALSRGCSIYLPDRVIPMLPEKLSNGLCSLNPGVKRLALTAKLCYDKTGELIEKSFYRSVICSNARLTYKKVQGFFDGNEACLQELKPLKTELTHARELMRLLQNRRKQKGCIDLNSAETKVYFENGELMVEGRASLESERMIEEFMIAANSAVAEYLYFLQAPCAYRVHETPSPEKLLSLAEFFNALGVKPQWRGEKVYPAQLQKTLENAEDYSEELKFIASNAVLRSMQKAYYSPREDGHFGLNEKYYCHFTSPIRRYPDLFVHRVLKAVICGRVDNVELCEAACSNVCASSSELEKRAEKIERAVCDVYVCEFMRQFLGDYFEGVISGVNSFGFFVRLENTAEGLVKLETLPRDNYAFNEKTCSLSGKKLSFSVGKKVIVKLVAADVFSGKLTFNLQAFIK